MTLPIATSCMLLFLGLIWERRDILNTLFKALVFGLGLAGLLSALRVF